MIRLRCALYSIAALALLFGYAAIQRAVPADDKPVKGFGRLRLFTPHDELYSVHINPSGTGWTVGKFGRILRTGDVGKSWTEQHSRTTKPLTSVTFIDEFHGFVAGGGGIILATVDGGQTWRTQNSGTKDHLLEAHASSSSRAFVAGAFGTLLSTRDGGASWLKHSLSWGRLAPRLIREKGPVEPNLNTVYFIDDNEGWLGGEFGLILHTRDAGQSWTIRRAGADLPQIVSIRFRDRLTGWAVGAGGTLLRTHDGGNTWREISAGTKRDFYAIWIDGAQGVIAGHGIALKTNDGGLEWVPVGSPTTDTPWLSGAAGNGDAAIVVGQAGTLLRLSLKSQRKAAAR